MYKKDRKQQEYYYIDLIHIFRTLWRKAWAILAIGVLSGVITLVGTLFLVTPKYSSAVMLYVNNRSLSLGSTSVSISASEISAAQSLVDTYIVILKNRTTMSEVAERCGVDRTYGELMEMVEAKPITGTEVFKVTVTSDDPNEAALIANCIADVLPERIEDIIEGSSMRIVDSAVVNESKVSPNVTKNTSVATVLGCFFAAILFAVIALFDDTVQGEEYISRSYDIPILAKVPYISSEKRSAKGK